jgi:hypothetical protein
LPPDFFSPSFGASATRASLVRSSVLTLAAFCKALQVLAGYETSLNPINGNAQIGTVSVVGDWIGSDLVAGVEDGGAADFGDAGDTINGGGASIAKIASIVIGGIV